MPLGAVDEDRIRAWFAALAARVEAGELSAKTANNARTCLSVALNEAARRGLLPRNPCAGVPALPVDRQELDFLRLDEIDVYLDACMPHYRPLAHFLIGTGARVSEAIAIKSRHLLLARIWELRDDLSAYDAAYVALAELLDCSLLTADSRLARAPGTGCSITFVPL